MWRIKSTLVTKIGPPIKWKYELNILITNYLIKFSENYYTINNEDMLECFSKTVYIHLSRSVVEGFLAGLTFRFQSKIPSTVHSAILIKILTKFIFLILDIIKYRNNDANQNFTAITMVIMRHIISFRLF